MKYLILFLSILGLTIGCNSSKKTTTNIPSNLDTYALQSKRNICDLKNRIPICDSALVFMDDIIIPIASYPQIKAGLMPERTLKINIKGETNDFWQSDKYHFYINPDCFIGLSAINIFEIFCIKDSIDSFLEIDKNFQNAKKSYSLQVRSLNNFAMGIRIQEGKVIHASVGDGMSVSHSKKTILKNICDLKDKIPNCDSALVFMSSVIEPLPPLRKDGSQLSFTPREKITSIIIRGETKEFWKTKKYNFYINPDCLIGLPSLDVFEIFCHPSKIQEFIEIDKMYQRKNTEWFLSVGAINGFQIGIKIKDGKITNASVGGGTKIP